MSPEGGITVDYARSTGKSPHAVSPHGILRQWGVATVAYDPPPPDNSFAAYRKQVALPYLLRRHGRRCWTVEPMFRAVNETLDLRHHVYAPIGRMLPNGRICALPHRP